MIVITMHADPEFSFDPMMTLCDLFLSRDGIATSEDKSLSDFTGS
jgi:hypothetical protein